MRAAPSWRPRTRRHHKSRAGTPSLLDVEGLTYCVGLAMKLSAARQPTGYIGRLQQRPLGWEVGCQIPRNGNEDMPALVAIAPLLKLPRPRLEHLTRASDKRGTPHPLAAISAA